MKKAILIISMTGLMLTGCGTVKLCYVERPKETDISQSMKQGNVFNRKPIVGKGYDVIVKGGIDSEIVTKDGTVIKVKTIKSSFLEKMFGWMYILKPNNVGVGGK